MRLFYLIFAGLVLILDQATKFLIASRFDEFTIVPVIPGFFQLVRVENRGMAFGILSESSSTLVFVLLVSVSLVALAVVTYLLLKNPISSASTTTGLALILGGAAGNLVDRIARGKVIDFLDFYYGSFHWHVFNIADVAIVLGAGLLLLDLLRSNQDSVEAPD